MYFVIIALFICRLTKNIVVIQEHLVDGTRKFLVVTTIEIVPSIICMFNETKNLIR